jgi:hypothetical protein
MKDLGNILMVLSGKILSDYEILVGKNDGPPPLFLTLDDSSF